VLPLNQFLAAPAAAELDMGGLKLETQVSGESMAAAVACLPPQLARRP
jgi:hypothetical protein